MSENDKKLNALWNLTDIVHKEIIKIKEELEEFKKYSDRTITKHEEDLASLYQQSFDLYSEILLTSLVISNRQTPSAYDTKTDYNSCSNTSETEFKKLRIPSPPTNTFDKNSSNSRYRSSHRPDTSKWYEEDDHDFYEGN
jgi:hypothetical protein